MVKHVYKKHRQVGRGFQFKTKTKMGRLILIDRQSLIMFLKKKISLFHIFDFILPISQRQQKTEYAYCANQKANK